MIAAESPLFHPDSEEIGRQHCEQIAEADARLSPRPAAESAHDMVQLVAAAAEQVQGRERRADAAAGIEVQT